MGRNTVPEVKPPAPSPRAGDVPEGNHSPLHRPPILLLLLLTCPLPHSTPFPLPLPPFSTAPLPRPQPCVTCPPGVPPSAAGWRRGHERSDQSSREAGRRSRWMRREERLSDVPAFSSRSLAGGRYRSRRGRHDVTPPLYKGPLGRFSFFPQRWHVFALGMEFRKTEAFPLMPLKLCVMDEDSVTAAPKYYSHRQTGTYKLETRNGTT